MPDTPAGPSRVRKKRRDHGTERATYIERLCDRPECGTLVRRRASEVRDRLYCSRLCYQMHGAGVAGRGRPRTADTRTVTCPDGEVRSVVITEDGYWQVYWPEHPNANTRGRVGLHRLVMADLLERPLLPGETAHHRNGDRSDNRPENLELWSSWQPPGQRVADKVAWAKELLAAYEPDALSPEVRVSVPSPV